MATKEEFLNKLARKLNRERVHTVARPRFSDHPADHLYQDYTQQDFVELFSEEFTKLGGSIHPVSSEQEIGITIQRILARQGLKRLIAWPAPTPAVAIDTNLFPASEGYELVYWQARGQRDELLRTAEQSEAGLVYAEYGLAETGTVILYNQGGHGRLVSLLPNQSIIVLRASTILPRLTQALPRIGTQTAAYSCINLITGPSRTSDIEMDLTIGVHGPGKIAIVLIEDHILKTGEMNK